MLQTTTVERRTRHPKKRNKRRVITLLLLVQSLCDMRGRSGSVSTHAPAGGATIVDSLHQSVIPVSIHATR